MERFTISLGSELARDFDDFIAERSYGNRSEAMRDLIRSAIEAHRHAARETERQAHCVANLSYVFDHHSRDLAERLTELQHDHHDLSVATMHAHLDHRHCLESTILRGPTKAVRRFADMLIAERGVHNGQLNVITAELDQAAHFHGEHSPRSGESREGHFHYKPKR